MRRSFVTVGLALLVGASIVQAQSQQQEPAAPSASQAAPAQAAPADPLRFSTSDAAIVMQVLPGKGAEFEAGYGQMLAQLAASTKPGLKELGASMKVFKVATGAPADQPSLYLIQITGASKDLSYNFGKILFYSGKDPGDKYDGIFEKQEEATAVYAKLKDAFTANGINPWPLGKIGG